MVTVGLNVLWNNLKSEDPGPKRQRMGISDKTTGPLFDCLLIPMYLLAERP